MISAPLYWISFVCATITCYLLNQEPQDPLYSSRNLTIRHHLFRSNDENTPPIVQTNYGAVEGYKMASITKKVIYAFEGIPFAENPGGKNRFKLAIPKTPWKGLFQAKNPHSRCPQLHVFQMSRIRGTEDCLHIYVYSSFLPKNKTNPKLPVIVFIHGGTFLFSGGSEYGPAYLMEEDIIYVTFNYRLNVFGFLSVDDKNVMPDNLGFKDQALAMKWIHENIEYFGGDKNRVTLMGLSSGATSVHLHYMSNLTRNYFDSGISISGSAFTPGTIMTRKASRAINKRLASLTLCPNPYRNNSTATARFIACLRRIPYPILIGRNLNLFSSTLTRFGAVIEDSRTPGAFLVEHPDDVYLNKRIAPKPWIATRTRDEGVQYLGFEFTLQSPRIMNMVLRGFKRIASSLLDFGYGDENRKDALMAKTLEFYLGGRPPYKSGNSSVLGDILTDGGFLYPLNKALRYHTQFAPTYSYLYDYKAKNSLHRMVGTSMEERQKYDVCHSDDIATITNMTSYLDNYKTTDKDYAVVKLLANLFKNFAATGRPVFTDTNGNEYEVWKPIPDPYNLQFLNINNEVKMIPEPIEEKRRLKFWDNLRLESSRPWKLIT